MTLDTMRLTRRERAMLALDLDCATEEEWRALAKMLAGDVMSLAELVGESRVRRNGRRTDIPIDHRTRMRFRDLLVRPEMKGVSFSEFIDRAITAALAELDS